jgi:hypothetical protein
MKLLALTLASFLTTASVARSAISLSILSNCDDLSRMQLLLADQPLQCGSHGGNTLERALAERVRGLKVCYLENPPTDSLQGFHCLIVVQAGTQRILNCTRPANYADVLDYEANYSRNWDALVKQYLAAADTCSVGTKGAAPTNQTPILTAWIAKADIGFMLALGSGLVGQGAVVHGFGQVDPDISGEDHAEVEFVEMFYPLK